MKKAPHGARAAPRKEVEIVARRDELGAATCGDKSHASASPSYLTCATQQHHGAFFGIFANAFEPFLVDLHGREHAANRSGKHALEG